MNFLYTIFIFTATTLVLLIIALSALILKTFIGKSVRNGLLFNFNRLYEYQTELARKWPNTFRLLAQERSQIFTTDLIIIEHLLKTSFEKYSKGDYNKEIVRDLLGQGIFSVNGEKWRQQRKLMNSQFSAHVLRDFSCGVFRKNAAKIVRIASEFSVVDTIFDMQVVWNHLAI